MNKTKRSTKSNVQSNWKQNSLVQATAEAILEVVDELTFVDDGDLVGPSSRDILRALPAGVSLSDVEANLSVLTEMGLLRADECGCDCGSRIYFRVCGNGVPLVLHECESDTTAN